MTIETLSSSTTLSGNGTTTVFPYGFEIPNSSDIQVYVTVNGVTTLLGAGSYSVSGLGSPNGGTVTYPLIGSPLSSGSTITIERVLPFVQATQFSTQANFIGSVLEAALDYITMLCQQLYNQINQMGGTPLYSFVDGISPTGTKNGSNVTFTLPSAPNPALSLQLNLNGVTLTQNTDYTLNGLTITMSSAPASTDTMECWYRT